MNQGQLPIYICFSMERRTLLIAGHMIFPLILSTMLLWCYPLPYYTILWLILYDLNNSGDIPLLWILVVILFNTAYRFLYISKSVVIFPVIQHSILQMIIYVFKVNWLPLEKWFCSWPFVLMTLFSDWIESLSVICFS